MKVPAVMATLPLELIEELPGRNGAVALGEPHGAHRFCPQGKGAARHRDSSRAQRQRPCTDGCIGPRAAHRQAACRHCHGGRGCIVQQRAGAHRQGVCAHGKRRAIRVQVQGAVGRIQIQRAVDCQRVAVDQDNSRGHQKRAVDSYVSVQCQSIPGGTLGKGKLVERSLGGGCGKCRTGALQDDRAARRGKCASSRKSDTSIYRDDFSVAGIQLRTRTAHRETPGQDEVERIGAHGRASVDGKGDDGRILHKERLEARRHDCDIVCGVRLVSAIPVGARGPVGGGGGGGPGDGCRREVPPRSWWRNRVATVVSAGNRDDCVRPADSAVPHQGIIHTRGSARDYRPGTAAGVCQVDDFRQGAGYRQRAVDGLGGP